MSANTEDGKPLLASLVQAGEQQTEAIAITDFVHMAKDISNAYLVNTADGDVLVNSGFITSTERNKSVFAKARSGPLIGRTLGARIPPGLDDQINRPFLQM